MFEASAAGAPAAPLLDFMGRKYSYAEVRSGVDRVACGLAALGIGPSSRLTVTSTSCAPSG